VEIRDAVGPENFFLFGLTAEEVEARQRAGYDPRPLVAADPELQRALAAMSDGTFGPPGLFDPLVRSIAEHDPFLVVADLASYAEAQERVSRLWLDPRAWARASILNVARMGFFSSDRSIREYAERVWGVVPVAVTLGEG